MGVMEPSPPFLPLPSIKRSNCYMVWGGEFASTTQQARVSHTDLVIGCLVDLATGLMTFTANGKEINTFFQVGPHHGPPVRAGGGSCPHPRDSIALSLGSAASSVQVEPNTKLFPAVFALPTSQNVVQFELGKLKVMPGARKSTWGGGL